MSKKGRILLTIPLVLVLGAFVFNIIGAASTYVGWFVSETKTTAFIVHFGWQGFTNEDLNDEEFDYDDENFKTENMEGGGKAAGAFSILAMIWDLIGLVLLIVGIVFPGKVGVRKLCRTIASMFIGMAAGSGFIAWLVFIAVFASEVNDEETTIGFTTDTWTPSYAWFLGLFATLANFIANCCVGGFGALDK
ncbi:hypothetical protein QOT17_009241 [Balamuthia mandrillaris]